jgi:hypothetical protein
MNKFNKQREVLGMNLFEKVLISSFKIQKEKEEILICLEDMFYQFACRKNGKFFTGGLSSLEYCLKILKKFGRINNEQIQGNK